METLRVGKQSIMALQDQNKNMKWFIHINI
jgi:hypothetical protein